MTTLEPASVALKFAFLAVLYLFLLWVVRSALKDLRDTRDAGLGASALRRRRHAAARRTDVDATGMHRAGEPVLGHGGAADGEPRLRGRARGRPPRRDRVRSLEHGATLGRGDVEIRLEDPFASIAPRAHRRGRAPCWWSRTSARPTAPTSTRSR